MVPSLPAVSLVTPPWGREQPHHTIGSCGVPLLSSYRLLPASPEPRSSPSTFHGPSPGATEKVTRNREESPIPAQQLQQNRTPVKCHVMKVFFRDIRSPPQLVSVQGDWGADCPFLFSSYYMFSASQPFGIFSVLSLLYFLSPLALHHLQVQ